MNRLILFKILLLGTLMIGTALGLSACGKKGEPSKPSEVSSLSGSF